MKKILVPTDFSEQSINAFRFAIQLAVAQKSQIQLLHVIELPVMHDTTLMPTLSFEQQYMKDASDMAEKNFKRLIKVAKGENAISWSVEYGNATTMILDYCKKKKADLIVMGTKGATGLKEYFVGSNTEKIVRLSPVPVIALPEATTLSSIKNIIFPTPLYGSQEAVVPQIRLLQSMLHAKLHVVYINTPANFRRDKQTTALLEQFAKKNQLKNYDLHVYNDISEEEGLVNFASHIGGCLLAMPTHGRRGIAHLMAGSIAEDVVNHIHFPVWTFRTGRR
ncbi:MAG: universal stress protein [Bacteroidetes bacterium]|nr:universal stress protein [Bacteroidota bacterium]